jgi:periplasmic copper chaperone A
MTRRAWWWRGLSAVIVIGATVAVAGPAGAHVEVDPSSAPRGATVVFGFRVPTEERNASTVRLDVQFPTDQPIADVLVEQKLGWSFTTQTTRLARPIKTSDGTVTDVVAVVSWIATAEGIPPGAFDEFNVLATLPNRSGTLTFKAVQTYSNGDVIRWIETPTKGAPPPEHPAPTLRLARGRPSGG